MYIRKLKFKVQKGLTKVNATVLEDTVTLVAAKRELKEMLEQIPKDWDAHESLEYAKVAVRTVLSGLVGKNNV